MGYVVVILIILAGIYLYFKNPELKAKVQAYLKAQKPNPQNLKKRADALEARAKEAEEVRTQKDRIKAANERITKAKLP